MHGHGPHGFGGPGPHGFGGPGPHGPHHHLYGPPGETVCCCVIS